jgi:hypothetical protein
VEDTRDTAFVIFSVVCGMAVGVGHVEVALVGLVIVGLGCAMVRVRPKVGARASTGEGDTRQFWTLVVRVGVTENPEELLAPLFGRRLADPQLISAETGRQGSAIDLTYRTRLSAAALPADVVAELNLLDGVQGVEIRRL